LSCARSQICIAATSGALRAWRTATRASGGAAADLALDGVDLADAQQGLGGDRRGGAGVDLEEAPAQMDHPNTIAGLRFTVSVPFFSRIAAPRRRRPPQAA
jgi:hypothetical protein